VASDTVVVEIDEPAVARVNFVACESETSISWVIRKEVERALQSDGGDHEPTPPAVASSVAGQNQNYQFSISTPGEYRLYCQVDTSDSTSAVANIPFLVASADSIAPPSTSNLQNTMS